MSAEAREEALARRHLAREIDLQDKSTPLKPLVIGDVVQVQNQWGNHASKWDLSGLIAEKLDFDAYFVKMDGTGRTTKRNRRFLRKIVPYTNIL